MENQSITNSIGKGVKGIFIGGNPEGDVSYIINELPSSTDPDQPGIKESLAKLTTAIKDDTNLNQEEKERALEQVKALAEASTHSNEGEMKKLAKNATTMLKGIISDVPAAAKLVQEWHQLLPLITKILGLG
ncbi:MAG: hypothetical protein ACM37W_22665 [Actinomycetota bacterium]